MQQMVYMEEESEETDNKSKWRKILHQICESIVKVLTYILIIVASFTAGMVAGALLVKLG
jgi:hypothetical protein